MIRASADLGFQPLAQHSCLFRNPTRQFVVERRYTAHRSEFFLGELHMRGSAIRVRWWSTGISCLYADYFSVAAMAGRVVIAIPGKSAVKFYGIPAPPPRRRPGVLLGGLIERVGAGASLPRRASTLVCRCSPSLAHLCRCRFVADGDDAMFASADEQEGRPRGPLISPLGGTQLCPVCRRPLSWAVPGIVMAEELVPDRPIATRPWFRIQQVRGDAALFLSGQADALGEPLPGDREVFLLRLAGLRLSVEPRKPCPHVLHSPSLHPLSLYRQEAARLGARFLRERQASRRERRGWIGRSGRSGQYERSEPCSLPFQSEQRASAPASDASDAFCVLGLLPEQRDPARLDMSFVSDLLPAQEDGVHALSGSSHVSSSDSSDLSWPRPATAWAGEPGDLYLPRECMRVGFPRSSPLPRDELSDSSESLDSSPTDDRRDLVEYLSRASIECRPDGIAQSLCPGELGSLLFDVPADSPARRVTLPRALSCFSQRGKGAALRETASLGSSRLRFCVDGLGQRINQRISQAIGQPLGQVLSQALGPIACPEALRGSLSSLRSRMLSAFQRSEWGGGCESLPHSTLCDAPDGAASAPCSVMTSNSPGESSRGPAARKPPASAEPPGEPPGRFGRVINEFPQLSCSDVSIPARAVGPDGQASSAAGSGDAGTSRFLSLDSELPECNPPALGCRSALSENPLADSRGDLFGNSIGEQFADAHRNIPAGRPSHPNGGRFPDSLETPAPSALGGVVRCASGILPCLDICGAEGVSPAPERGAWPEVSSVSGNGRAGGPDDSLVSRASRPAALRSSSSPSGPSHPVPPPVVDPTVATPTPSRCSPGRRPWPSLLLGSLCNLQCRHPFLSSVCPQTPSDDARRGDPECRDVEPSGSASSRIEPGAVDLGRYDLALFCEDPALSRNLLMLYSVGEDSWEVHPLTDQLPSLSAHCSTIIGERFAFFLSARSGMNEMMMYDILSGNCSETSFYGVVPGLRADAMFILVQPRRHTDTVYILGGASSRDGYAVPLAHLALRVKDEKMRSEFIRFLLSKQYPTSQRLRGYMRLESFFEVRPAPLVIDQRQLL